jgi:hypothetical protein
MLWRRMRVVVRDSLGTPRSDYTSTRHDRIIDTLSRHVRALLPPAPSRWLRNCAQSDMAVVLLLFAISVSFIAIRMGAVAFELTGVPWEHAKFRALSAVTNAGFTTRESEEITSHTLRRRIASFLIVVGNAGLITTIGSLASSLSQPQPLRVIVNLSAIIAGITALGWVAHRPAVTRVLHERVHRYPLQTWASDELLRLDKGYVLTKFELARSSPAVDHTLRQLRLRQNRVQVLAVERARDFHAVPDGEF